MTIQTQPEIDSILLALAACKADPVDSKVNTLRDLFKRRQTWVGQAQVRLNQDIETYLEAFDEGF